MFHVGKNPTSGENILVWCERVCSGEVLCAIHPLYVSLGNEWLPVGEVWDRRDTVWGIREIPCQVSNYQICLAPSKSGIHTLTHSHTSKTPLVLAVWVRERRAAGGKSWQADPPGKTKPRAPLDSWLELHSSCSCSEKHAGTGSDVCMCKHITGQLTGPQNLQKCEETNAPIKKALKSTDCCISGHL